MDTYNYFEAGEVRALLRTFCIPTRVVMPALDWLKYVESVARPDADGNYDYEVALGGPDDTNTPTLCKIEISVALDVTKALTPAIEYRCTFTKEEWMLARLFANGGT